VLGDTDALTLELGETLLLGDTLGETEADGLTLALGLTLGLTDGLALALGLTLAEGDTLGDIDGDTLALGLIDADGETDGLGLALGNATPALKSIKVQVFITPPAMILTMMSPSSPVSVPSLCHMTIWPSLGLTGSLDSSLRRNGPSISRPFSLNS
jgi:hypothetical protein